MENRPKNLFIYLTAIILSLISCTAKTDENVGNTTITKWQGDKRSAVSLTFDDGIIHQFTVARPILNKLGLPGTFFIITGKIAGSAKGRFIGRPQEEIIKETATIKTDADNYFERASLIAFTGTEGAVAYHSNSGALFESGKVDEAYGLIDEGYEKIRNGTIEDGDAIIYHSNPTDTTTWKDYKRYAEEGHEIASHTVTHARLAVLDEANLLYELEQSKKDIIKFLGKESTFSAECPYGTENGRVMEYAHKMYPALRNRMPEPYLAELNRGSDSLPADVAKEYIQWQRGALTDDSMAKMKSWIDTSLESDNVWLVLVFHGVDGIGWEPKTGAQLEEYFGYMKDRQEDLWIATFADVTKYIRERKNTEVRSKEENDVIKVTWSTELDPQVYNVPLTAKTYVPKPWKTAFLDKKSAENNRLGLKIQKDSLGSYVVYDVLPDNNQLLITE